MPRKLTEERAAEHGILPEEDTAAGRNGPSHDAIRIAANDMVKLQAEREAINAKISTYRKGLKAKGFTLGVFDDVVKMLAWTPEEIKQHYDERQWYAESLRFPIGSQLEFFGGANTPDPVKEQLRWKNIGFKDGLAGRGWADDAPEGCPTDCFQVYGQGHEDGQAAVRAAYADEQRALQSQVPPASEGVEDLAEAEGPAEQSDIEDGLDDAARRLKRSGFMDTAALEVVA